MNRSLVWRAVVIVGVVALAAWRAYPPKDNINLGLDLQGGMHLVLQVKTADAVRSETDKDMDQLRRELTKEELTGVTTRRTGDATFELTGVTPDGYDKVDEVAKDIFYRGPGQGEKWEWSRQGEGLAFTMAQANQSDIREQAVIQALQTIRNRVDAFGVSEPVIARQGIGGDRIVVQLPGVDDPERIRRLIKSTAFLEFRLVDQRDDKPSPTRQGVLEAYGGQLPPDVEILPQDLRSETGRATGQQFWALLKNRVITGRDLKTARPGQGQFREPVVQFELTADGARQFGKVTGESIGRKLAIILDGKVQSAPVIEDRITDSGIIRGQFTPDEVTDLSMVLRSGALPAGIDYLEERTVGASLGADSIAQGIRAGILGGILVVLTMLIVYRLSGVNAVVSLVLNIVLIFGALAYFGATLTLPGIAGIVLTIGMAVDANVLVFERIKEELAVGRTVKSSIDEGFGKALSSITDANVTTLIAALFLFQFGTGPIRGFAVTLSIGILGTLFTAVFVSRFLFDLTLSRRQRVEKLSI
jgi:preprotein translocase subunit SecD